MSNTFLEDNKLAIAIAGGITIGAGITYFANKKSAEAAEKSHVYYEVNLDINNLKAPAFSFSLFFKACIISFSICFNINFLFHLLFSLPTVFDLD